MSDTLHDNKSGPCKCGQTHTLSDFDSIPNVLFSDKSILRYKTTTEKLEQYKEALDLAMKRLNEFEQYHTMNDYPDHEIRFNLRFWFVSDDEHKYGFNGTLYDTKQDTTDYQVELVEVNRSEAYDKIRTAIKFSGATTKNMAENIMLALFGESE
jgi:hypothetical protein